MPPRTKKTSPPASDEDAAAVATLDGDKPAEAAAAEALADPDETITIPFRGHDFVVERTILRSARLLVAVASGQAHQILFEILGPKNAAAFISLLERGEEMPGVAAEFLTAVNKAAGLGNS